MRDRSNTVSAQRKIPSADDVRVVSQSADSAPEMRPLSIRVLAPTAATGLGRVGREQEPHRNACHRSQDFHSSREKPSGPLQARWQVRWIFQRNASARSQSYENQPTSFIGKSLSLGTMDAPAVESLPGMKVLAFPPSLIKRPQVWSLVAITTCDSSTQADITAKPAVRCGHMRQRHIHGDTGIPGSPAPIHFRALVELRAGQSKGSIDRSMLACRNIEAAVFAGGTRGASDHNPAIEPFCLLGLLNLRAVNEFGFQERRQERVAMDRFPILHERQRLCCFINRLEQASLSFLTATSWQCPQGSGQIGLGPLSDGACRFGLPVPVLSRPPIGASVKLAHALGTREARRLCACDLLCGSRVQALIESRQRRKRIGFDTRGEQFQLIRESNLCCHADTITTLPQKRNRVSSRQWLQNGPSDCASRDLCKLRSPSLANAI